MCRGKFAFIRGGDYFLFSCFFIGGRRAGANGNDLALAPGDKVKPFDWFAWKDAAFVPRRIFTRRHRSKQKGSMGATPPPPQVPSPNYGVKKSMINWKEERAWKEGRGKQPATMERLPRSAQTPKRDGRFSGSSSHTIAPEQGLALLFELTSPLTHLPRIGWTQASTSSNPRFQLVTQIRHRLQHWGWNEPTKRNPKISREKFCWGHDTPNTRDTHGDTRTRIATKTRNEKRDKTRKGRLTEPWTQLANLYEVSHAGNTGWLPPDAHAHSHILPF